MKIENKYKFSFNNNLFCLRNYHKKIKSKFIKLYGNNKTYLCDIGSAYLKSLQYWKENNIKNVFTIEPSENYYKKGLLRITKNKNSLNIYSIWGYGNMDWSKPNNGLNSESQNNLKKMNSIKFDLFTFEFSIHYMLDNNILFENINKHSKKGSIIIIHCLNGTKLYNNIFCKKDVNYFSINDEKYTYFKIYRLFKNYNASSFNNKIAIYLKGAQGLNDIIKENLINLELLIQKFNEIQFELIRLVPFIDNHDIDQSDLNNIELTITSFYMTLILKKK